jgi:hypothetical protein
LLGDLFGRQAQPHAMGTQALSDLKVINCHKGLLSDFLFK